MNPVTNNSMDRGLFNSPLTQGIPSKENNLEKLPLSSSSDAMSTLVLDDAPVPLIDLSSIEQAQGEKRKVLIKQFGDGLKNVGFVAIKADSLTKLISRVNEEMKSYFSQPLEEKMKDWRNNNATGFSQQGRETAAGAKKADLKETFFIPPNYTDWPKNRPNFQIVMEPYHLELTKFATKLMAYIAEYLNETTEDVTQSVSSAFNLLRLAYYPAPKPEDDPEAVWASAHEDLNALTLLPPSEIPGLQLQTKEGRWMSVNIPQGYLIVNTGEQLQNKTAGMIKATSHKVVNPGGVHARTERFASIFFASWSPDFSLSPFKSCINIMTSNMSETEKEEYLKHFPNVNVQENLLSRLIEMRTIPDPTQELVQSLLHKGLLKKPPKELVELYPEFFSH
jgi:isopenicillin N synthase-like dioxygenase